MEVRLLKIYLTQKQNNKMKKLPLLLICFLLLNNAFAQNKWEQFKDKDFQLMFPQKPVQESQIIQSEIGPLNLDMYTYQPAEAAKDLNALYMITYVVYPDSIINSDKKEMIKGVFRGAIDGAVGNIKGKLVSEKEITYKGFPGREAKISFQDGAYIMMIHAFIVKNKMYMLQTVSEIKNDDNKMTTQFFNSFQLTQ